MIIRSKTNYTQCVNLILATPKRPKSNGRCRRCCCVGRSGTYTVETQYLYIPMSYLILPSGFSPRETTMRSFAVFVAFARFPSRLKSKELELLAGPVSENQSIRRQHGTTFSVQLGMESSKQAVTCPGLSNYTSSLELWTYARGEHVNYKSPLGSAR